jgi:hypothetical protein
MRKIFAFIMTTVDGYYEGRNQEFDFWVIDDEFNEFSVQQLDEADALAFGRVTYEAMAAYWPTSAAGRGRPEGCNADERHAEDRRLTNARSRRVNQHAAHQCRRRPCDAQAGARQADRCLGRPQSDGEPSCRSA